MHLAEENRPADIWLDSSDGIPSLGGRVLEIRKEKSRDAARSRRGKENYEFYELAKLLPLPAAITSQLDKASIIRLSISYLKLRDYCAHGEPSWTRDAQGARRMKSSTASDMFEQNQGAYILQSLDGFAFVLGSDGRFLYISETVSIYLGLSQVEMAGSSIFDYVHRQDQEELAAHLGLVLSSITSTLNSPSPIEDSPQSTRAETPLHDMVPSMTPDAEKGLTRSLCVRMKSTLTKRGVHSRSSGYRVVLLLGQFRCQCDVDHNMVQSLVGFSGVAIALPPPAITELRIEADTFIMRLASNLKIIYCENVINEMTDWKTDDICGKDLFSLCHPGDIPRVVKVHTDLLNKGQVLSPSLRLLNKGGGYIWIQLCCTTLYSSKTSDDHTFLAIVQTVSGIENRDLVLDISQLKTSGITSRSTVLSDIDSVVVDPQSCMSLSTEDSQTASNSDQSDTDEKDTSENQLMNKEDIRTKSVLNKTNSFKIKEKKSDNRISRRKTDRPKKRKRKSDADQSLVSQTHHELISKNTEPHCNYVYCCDSYQLGMKKHSSVCSGHNSSNKRALKNGTLCLNEKTSAQQLNPEDLSIKQSSSHRTKTHTTAANATVSTECLNGASNYLNASETAKCRQLTSKLRLPDDDQLQIIDPVWFRQCHPPSTRSLHLLKYNMLANRDTVIRTSLTKNSSDSNMSSESMQKDSFRLHFPTLNHKSTNYKIPDIGFLIDELGTIPAESIAPPETCVFSESDLSCPHAKIVTNPEFSFEKSNAIEGISSPVEQPFLRTQSYNNMYYIASSNQTIASTSIQYRTNSTRTFWYGSPNAS
ncbi:neuronal PAS domain-containing protein 3-like isoform X1 [Dreissena polymorpha]|uniref:neuronal PAS domain-containing protein 3-like isoform X1 n=1 Tax=Dreissena polymorpha TaxID=45954 RepID=UPI0022651CA9|nr:neuronal PAS domain-containing protein 3-like isoform X1 [Dreissena polymorpha]